MKVRIVKEVKRSDGLWRFACGDVLFIICSFMLRLVICLFVSVVQNYDVRWRTPVGANVKVSEQMLRYFLYVSRNLGREASGRRVLTSCLWQPSAGEEQSAAGCHHKRTPPQIFCNFWESGNVKSRYRRRGENRYLKPASGCYTFTP